MARMSVEIPHGLTKADALSRIQQLLPRVKQEQAERVNDLTENWNGETCDFGFTALGGMKISGKLIVGNATVKLDGEIPWVLLAFKGIIERTIREQAEKLLR